MNSESNKIRALEDKYGLPLFGMALTHLVDVGVRHLTEENVENSVRTIMDGGVNTAKCFITPEFQCAIIRCASELAQFGIWDLFRYIKHHMVIGGV